VHAYRALQQTGVTRVYVGEHLSQRDALGRLQMNVMVANWTREIRPSRMKRGACGNVGVMGVGLRPIGKSMESPPDPTMLRAPHFYPNKYRVRSGKTPSPTWKAFLKNHVNECDRVCQIADIEIGAKCLCVFDFKEPRRCNTPATIYPQGQHKLPDNSAFTASIVSGMCWASCQ
jgi:hypothetical protein